MDKQIGNSLQIPFLDILKSNAANFFSIYVFVGVIPFLFAGFKFDRLGLGTPKLIAIAVISGLVLFFIYCFLIYLKNLVLKKLR